MDKELIRETVDNVDRLIEMGKAFCNTRSYNPIQFKQATDGLAIQLNAEKDHKEWFITLVPDHTKQTLHVQVRDAGFDRIKDYWLKMEELKYANQSN
tara:strand:- start:268 stop:558 length:291 start_codon:yes stop_codon:yes gene_type:complete